MDSIKFYLRFNWIYEEFHCKKNWFLSQFKFLLEEIKVLGSNYNIKELIWSNQGFNCIIIEVWWPIRTWLKQSKTKDQTGIGAKRKGSNYNLSKDLITKCQNVSDQTENGHFTSQNSHLKQTSFMDNCSLPSPSSTVSSNRNIGDVLSLKALKSSWPLPAQGRLWPIKAGEKDEPRRDRGGKRIRRRNREAERKMGRQSEERKERVQKKNRGEEAVLEKPFHTVIFVCSCKQQVPAPRRKTRQRGRRRGQGE